MYSSGYTFLNMPRDSENRGGGTAMLYKTPLKMLLKPADDDFKFSNFEHACITNSSHSFKLRNCIKAPSIHGK